MRKIILLLLFWDIFVYAGLLEKKDTDTLWRIDGSKIEIRENKAAPGVWFSAASPKTIKITGNTDKSISMDAPGTDCQTYTVVKLDRDFNWLVFDIREAGEAKRGYKAWKIAVDNPKLSISQVRNPQPGFFAINIFDGYKGDKRALNSNLFVYLSNLKLQVGNFRMMSNPDHFVEVSSPAFVAKKFFEPGDKIKITVRTSEPAEDISVRLYTNGIAYPIKINGVEKLQLKPVDDAAKEWSAEIEVKTLKALKTSTFGKGGILVKAVILGGSIDMPVWGMIRYPFVIKK